METINNCYCVDFNYTLVDRNNGRQVRGSAQAIVGYQKSEIHKKVKQIITQNINEYWDNDRWGGLNLEWYEILVFVQVVNVLEFPESELQEWQANINKDILKHSTNY